MDFDCAANNSRWSPPSGTIPPAAGVAKRGRKKPMAAGGSGAASGSMPAAVIDAFSVSILRVIEWV